MSKMNSSNCTCKTTKMLCFLHGTVPKEKTAQMNSPNCTCKTTKMCFLHGLVPKGKAAQKAKDEIVCLVAKGMVNVDQGMGHGHYELCLSSQDCLDLVHCLRVINPKGRMRMRGPIDPIPV